MKFIKSLIVRAKYGKHISRLFNDDTVFFVHQNRVKKLELTEFFTLCVVDPKKHMFDPEANILISNVDVDSYCIEFVHSEELSFKVHNFYSSYKSAKSEIVEPPTKLETDINLILTHTLAPVPITNYNAMTMLVSRTIEKYSWCFPTISGIDGKRVAKYQTCFSDKWVYLIEHFGSFRVLDTTLNDVSVDNPNDQIYKKLMEDYVNTIIEKSSPTTDRAIIKVYEMLQGK